jgi:hypothetical protein
MDSLTRSWGCGAKCKEVKDMGCIKWLNGVEAVEENIKRLNDEVDNRCPWSERLDTEVVRKRLPGMMMDFGAAGSGGMRWDFNAPQQAFEAMRKVEEKRALLIAMSPNCGIDERW